MSQLLNTIASSVFSAGLGAAAFSYLRDRRILKAKAAVAEQTVGTDVDAARMANLDRRLSLVERAHDAEVEAMQSTINILKDRLDAALSRISLLEQRGEFENTRYRAAVRYIRSLRGWISQHVPGMAPPPIPPALEADFDDAVPGSI